MDRGPHDLRQRHTSRIRSGDQRGLADSGARTLRFRPRRFLPAPRQPRACLSRRS